VTGQGFEVTRIRTARTRPGLRPQDLAAVRAAALISGARVGGAFEGSPDLRFEPRAISPGEFRFEIGTAGSVTLILQTVLGPLATAASASRVEATGGTHVPGSPSFDYFARHYLSLATRLGLPVQTTLVQAGFHPKGGGEVRMEVAPWVRPSSLRLEGRGRLLELRGVSGAGRLKGGVAERQRDAAQRLLWEHRRLEAAWDIRQWPSGTPGSFVMLEAVYEHGRGAFGTLGERGVAAETVGERVARALLAFLEKEGAVDGHAADQLAVPLALSGGGGLVTTSEVTSHLLTVAETLSLFGIRARVTGLPGAPGALEVEAN
jgi:RNA 3'-terminal phosphate cyclase (ATP)